MENSVSRKNKINPLTYLTELIHSYRFNGKNISATSKIPKFSRVAEKPGIFEIISIAHQQASCQSEVSDIRINIRQLPSARVSHGKNVIEDVREGSMHHKRFSALQLPCLQFLR